MLAVISRRPPDDRFNCCMDSLKSPREGPSTSSNTAVSMYARCSKVNQSSGAAGIPQ